MNVLNTIAIDDIGYAVLINIDYRSNNETEAKDFFHSLYAVLLQQGFNFADRIFYRLGTRDSIVRILSDSIALVKSRSTSSKNFLRSIHLVPLSQFVDVTPQLAAI